jgi:hypothetical protein
MTIHESAWTALLLLVLLNPILLVVDLAREDPMILRSDGSTRACPRTPRRCGSC